jgi:hypothetical protein
MAALVVGTIVLGIEVAFAAGRSRGTGITGRSASPSASATGRSARPRRMSRTNWPG